VAKALVAVGLRDVAMAVLRRSLHAMLRREARFDMEKVFWQSAYGMGTFTVASLAWRMFRGWGIATQLLVEAGYTGPEISARLREQFAEVMQALNAFATNFYMKLEELITWLKDIFGLEGSSPQPHPIDTLLIDYFAEILVLIPFYFFISEKRRIEKLKEEEEFIRGLRIAMAEEEVLA